MLRFTESIEEEPSSRLIAIKQTGSVADYISEFEELSELVLGLSDEFLIKIFYNGLNQEMKEVIRMKEPKRLENHIAAVLKMETSALCRVISGGTKSETEGRRQFQSNPLRFSSSYNSQHHYAEADTRRNNSNPVTHKKDNLPSKPNSEARPRLKHSNEELDRMRKEFICFKCRAHGWTRAHKCPNKELRILTVINGIEMEVLDEEEESDDEETIVYKPIQELRT